MFVKAMFVVGMFLFGLLLPLNLRVIKTGEFTLYETMGSGVALLLISLKFIF